MKMLALWHMWCAAHELTIQLLDFLLQEQRDE